MFLETLAEKELMATLLALALLLVSAFIGGRLCEKIGAPKVVGEILGGMLWGGSCLYFFAPDMVGSIFKNYAGEGKVLNVFYQLGLIFLMFSSGYNTEIQVNKRTRKPLTLLIIGATVIPMLGGFFTAQMFTEWFMGDKGHEQAYMLVFMISIAITSIPVISKIFFDLGIMNTNFSNMVLTASTLQDLFLWIVLNLAVNMVSDQQTGLGGMLFTSAMTIALFGICLWMEHRHAYWKFNGKSESILPIAFIVLLFTVVLLSVIKINIMYSAFIVGYLMKFVLIEDLQQIKDKMAAAMDVSFAFFVPIYFALVGIQLNVLHQFSWERFLLFFAIAFVLEAIGVIIMLQLSNFKQTIIINLAVIMNTRGGPGIVLATVAYSNHIISIEYFTVLVLTVMLSSLLTGYWLRYQKEKRPESLVHLEK